MYEFDDFDDDYDGDGSRRWVWVAAIALMALAFGGIVVWSSSGDTVAFPTTTDIDAGTDITMVDASTDASTAVPTTLRSSNETTDSPASTATTPAPRTPARAPATGPTATTAPASASAPSPAPTPAPASADVTGSPSYPIEPDGTPVPIRVAFGRDTISITGFAPSDDAVERLSRFAAAYSKSEDAAVVADVTIDPTVPATVGVRFVELDSVRFRAGSTDVSADHAPEFDRIVGVLNLLPDTSVVVLGHANWPSDKDKNFALASARALSVTAYIVGQGIDPGRVSARSGDADDLLSTDDTEQALALNRRTEFIFSGLLT